MDLDPGLAIVGATGVMLAVFAFLGLRGRRMARAQMAALREAPRVEIEVLSIGRMSAMLLGTTGVVVFGSTALAIALGDWGRAHAAGFVVCVLLVTTAAIAVPTTFGTPWARVGRIVLEGDELWMEMHGGRQTIALEEDWALDDAIVPPGNHIEIVVSIAQDETRITFRYPIFLMDSLPVAEGKVAAPSGVLVGAEARVLHERLLARVRDSG